MTDNSPETKDEKRKKPLWKRLLKWTGITAAVLTGLFLLVCTLAVWILTPSRLTPLVEKYAGEYLDAEVKASRIELTFWHTFPGMRVDVDSLRIISRSLSGLSPEVRAGLPADADTLLTVGHFHGGLNILRLLGGTVALRDIVIERPAVNLFQVNDSVANYLILPPSEQTDTTSTPMPGISLSRFLIADSGPLRYRSLVDSTDIAVKLVKVELDGNASPRFRLEALNGSADLPMLDEYNFSNFTFGLDGTITWDAGEPYRVAADDMSVSLDDYTMTFSTAGDFSGSPVIESFSGRIDEISVAGVLGHLPPSVRPMAAPLKTDMTVSLAAALSRPWDMADSILPSFTATITVPECKAEYQTLHLRRFAAEMKMDFDGQDMNKSVFTIDRLIAVGEGVDLAIDGTATNVMTNPLVDGHLTGNVNLAKLPPQLMAQLPVQLSGLLESRARFRFAMSDLNKDSFHKVLAEGSVRLRHLSAVAEGVMTVRLNDGQFKFGTSDSFVSQGHKIDSLLQVSLKIDTLSATGMGMALEVKNFRAGAGAVNRASSADTTEINPFGGGIAVERLKFDAPADTMRFRLRDAGIGASLRRYKGESRSPLLTLKVNAARMMFGQALNRVSLRETDLDLTVHLNSNRHQSAPVLSSRPIAEQNDSIAIERARRRAARLAADSAAIANGNVDLTLDREDRKLLRQWDYNGHLKASRGSVTTPWFPLRNRLSNIDLRFNSDSIILTDLKYKAGESDFLINGTVSNIRRALTSRRDNVLGISFDVKSDTINVNQIVKALFAGTSVAEHTDSAAVWGSDDDMEVTRLEAEADTAATGPLLIPRNIDAHFRMRADNILYSDLELHRFRGDLLMYDGAVNLRNLSASTDIGGIALNGLYSSLNPDSLQFGLGMKVDRFKLDRLTSLVPAIDSLLPAMKDFAGIVNADIAVTTDLERNMDINIPSLRAAIKIEGDSLVLLDPDTFKTVSKWLLFKNKKQNMIDHLSVEVVVENSAVELYPFMFDIDRYRLGVMGSNDMAMNMNYHVSVLKSPIPFKFGINIKGTPEKMKIRLGGAKFKENMVVERQAIADNTRINLVQQIDNVFRRGVSKARLGRLNFRSSTGQTSSSDAADAPALPVDLDQEETLSYGDSLQMIRAGLIENPDTIRYPMH